MLMGKLETQPNCTQCSLSDPIKTLEAIKNSCLNQSVERHPGQLFFDAMKSAIELKQHNEEKIEDHCNTAKSRITLLVSAVFNIIKWVDDSMDLEMDPMKKLRKEFTEKLGACFIQVKAELDQFGSPQHDLKQNHSLGQDHCKTTIDNAMEAPVANQKKKKHQKMTKTPDHLCKAQRKCFDVLDV